MTKPHNIYNEPCACGQEWCAHFVEPPADCINRFPDAQTAECKKCGTTWHSDGQCLRCRRMGR